MILQVWLAAVALIIIIVVVIRTFWRRSAAPPERTPVQTDARTAPPSPAPLAPAGEESGKAALRAERALSEDSLWRYALNLGSGSTALSAQDRTVRDRVLQTLGAATLADRYFPRRPMLMPQLQAAVHDANARPTRLAEIIAQDPVLAGNVLRLANSVFYRLSPEPVDSIQRAVVVCGTDGLNALAVTALMQPVFSSAGEAGTRFPATLWERCSRAAIGAETCARYWCPADRQSALLLALMSALGPLVVYRVTQDKYREVTSGPPSLGLLLSLIQSHGDAMSRRIAELWQGAARMLKALDIALHSTSVITSDDDAEAAALAQSLLAGELLANLSVLQRHHLRTEEECRQSSERAGIPAPLFDTVWERLQRFAP